MRKIVSLFACALLGLALSSCVTTMKTAKTAGVSASLQNATVADLTVGERITYTSHPSKAIQRGGLSNIKQAVEAEALEVKGNGADILLDPQFVVSRRRSLFGSKITEVTVSGRPATYNNFRSLPDTVWSNPVFRGVYAKSAHRRGMAKGMPRANAAAKVKAPRTPAGRRSGFRMGLEFNGSVGIEESSSQAGANLIGGYQFGPYFYAGLGVGYKYMEMDGEIKGNGREYVSSEMHVVPFFAQIRLYGGRGSNALFFDFKGGCDFTVSGTFTDGSFLRPAIGYSFGDVDLSVFYQYEEFTGLHHTESRWSNSYLENAEDSFIGLSLQVKF